LTALTNFYRFEPILTVLTVFDCCWPFLKTVFECFFYERIPLGQLLFKLTPRPWFCPARALLIILSHGDLICLISRPGQSQGLLYTHLCYSLIHSSFSPHSFTAPPRPNG
jgi:hypothetical protein